MLIGLKMKMIRLWDELDLVLNHLTAPPIIRAALIQQLRLTLPIRFSGSLRSCRRAEAGVMTLPLVHRGAAPRCLRPTVPIRLNLTGVHLGPTVHLTVPLSLLALAVLHLIRGFFNFPLFLPLFFVLEITNTQVINFFDYNF